MAKSLKLIVEALLFASEKPLSVRDINACVPDAKLPEIRSALKVLTYEYEAMGRSFMLKEIGGGYQFRSRTEYGSYILRMLQTSPSRLSRAAMETLAIVAYKQPIIRQEIERLRGVDVGGILRTLLEKGLVKIMGRKDLPGRPLIYGTTKKFLEVFDLKNITALPSMKEMKAFGAADEELQAAGEHGEQAAAPEGGPLVGTPEQDNVPAPDFPEEQDGETAAQAPAPAVEKAEQDTGEAERRDPEPAPGMDEETPPDREEAINAPFPQMKPDEEPFQDAPGVGPEKSEQEPDAGNDRD
jgi:segregation and condensation protein B